MKSRNMPKFFKITKINKILIFENHKTNLRFLELTDCADFPVVRHFLDFHDFLRVSKQAKICQANKGSLVLVKPLRPFKALKGVTRPYKALKGLIRAISALKGI